MDIDVSGSCLCKGITFRICGDARLFAMCHCSRCRKATGSAHASNIFTGSGSIIWLSGESLINRYELPEADRFSKAFCATCGSPVPCVSRDGKRLNIPAGSLDDDPGIKPDVRIFCADTAPWYESVEDVQRFDAGMV